MNTRISGRIPIDYFLLVIALTVPFWLFGGAPLPLPFKLPVSALAAANPLIAALILTYLREGWAGVRALLSRGLDFRKIRNKAWYLPILLLNPLIMVLSYQVMLVANRPLPDPQIAWLLSPVYLTIFFVYGLGEELGWMGYAFDPVQDQWGALKASLAMGVFWGLFHLVPDLQNGQTVSWIFWQRLGSIGLRVLMVWIYNNTGRSVFAAVLFHAMSNLSWVLFPNNGSHYDPVVTGVITLLVTGLVLLGTDWRTLNRKSLGTVLGSG